MKLLSIYLYTCRYHREIFRVVWNCYQFTYILAGATGKYYCGMKLLSIYLYTCRYHREIFRVVWNCYQFTFILAGATGKYYCGMKLLSIYLYTCRYHREVVLWYEIIINLPIFTCRCHREVLLWYEFVINLPIYLQVPQGSITVAWNCYWFTYILAGASGSITVLWNCYQFTYILAGATGKYKSGMNLLSIYIYTCRCHREVLERYEFVINLPLFLQVPQGSITVVWNCCRVIAVMDTVDQTMAVTADHVLIFTYILAGATGKYYCGMKLLSCNCCDGHCGPNNGCNCGPCSQLDKEEEERKVEVTRKPKPSGPLIDSWTWGQQPGN